MVTKDCYHAECGAALSWASRPVPGENLATPSLVDVDAHGRIYVLEPFEYRVTAFDSTGVALGSMGRQGEGPGELEWAMSVSVLDDGRAYVHDGAGQIVELRMGDQTGTESAFNYAVILANLRHVDVGRIGVGGIIR